MDKVMEYKCLFGSKMLKLNNNRDEDWYIFVDKRGRDIKEKGYASISAYTKMINDFILGKGIGRESFKVFFLYQLSSPFINEENYPFNFFNILKYKSVWTEYLKAFINLEKAENLSQKADVLPKQFYHILYQYYMITENVHFISDEAKAQVQRIHDYEMPSSYFYELRDLINSL